jgi:hypothetical protein
MKSLTLLLRVLILVGYPLISMISTFGGLAISEFYRACVFLIAVGIFSLSLRNLRRGRLDIMLTLFFVLYGVRLLIDWLYVGIEGADRANLLFWVMVCIPVLATTRLGTVDEEALAEWLSRLALLVLILIFAAMLLGLNVNPWADAGASTAATERLQFEALNPILIGHVAGFVLICNTYLLVENQAKGLKWLFLLGGIVLAVIVIGLANSRGPIIAASLALLFFFLSRRYRWARLVPLVIVTGITISYLLYQDPQIIGNLTERFTEDTVYNPSDLGRVEAQESAIAAFIENPIFGAFYRDPMLAENQYPHNLIIESAMALGVVGLTLMILLHVRATVFVLSKSGGRHPLIVMLLIQQFISVSLSGAIWGADAFFMLMGMCHAFGKRPTVQSSIATREVVHRRAISFSPNNEAT